MRQLSRIHPYGDVRDSCQVGGPALSTSASRDYPTGALESGVRGLPSRSDSIGEARARRRLGEISQRRLTIGEYPPPPAKPNDSATWSVGGFGLASRRLLDQCPEPLPQDVDGHGHVRVGARAGGSRYPELAANVEVVDKRDWGLALATYLSQLIPRLPGWSHRKQGRLGWSVPQGRLRLLERLAMLHLDTRRGHAADNPGHELGTTDQ